MRGTFDPDIKLKLSCKWGFDGATGQSQYKQRLHGAESSDKGMFSTMLVPLHLTNGPHSIWLNPVSSSTRFCRPIKIQYARETTDLVVKEKNRVNDQVLALNPIIIKLVRDQQEYEVEVEYDMRLTMIDGSAVDAISANASHRVCNICKATPTQMNQKKVLTSLVSEPARLMNGLSVLHAYIRCFECILHISYRLTIKSWQMRGLEKKQECLTRKRAVQQKFKDVLGLYVDFPKD